MSIRVPASRRLVSCRARSPTPHSGDRSQRQQEGSRYPRRDPTQHHGRAELGRQFDRDGLGSALRALEHEVAALPAAADASLLRACPPDDAHASADMDQVRDYRRCSWRTAGGPREAEPGRRADHRPRLPGRTRIRPSWRRPEDCDRHSRSPRSTIWVGASAGRSGLRLGLHRTRSVDSSMCVFGTHSCHAQSATPNATTSPSPSARPRSKRVARPLWARRVSASAPTRTSPAMASAT